MTAPKFSCVQGCSDCCIYREYYPSMEYGKIGVLLLPAEKQEIESLALENNVSVKIVPRLAVGKETPDRVIAYQMMGKNGDGDLCPFLDVESASKSPHGGYRCRIYDRRPLACRAYPLVDSGQDAGIDEHCRFCKQFSTTRVRTDGIHCEIEALSKIKAEVKADDVSLKVWRYATATGSVADRSKLLPEGWVKVA